MEDGRPVGVQPAAPGPPAVTTPQPKTDDKPATFLETRDGRPSRLCLRGRWLPVLEVVDAWVIQGRWWSREERRLYTRLLTPAGTLDLCYREGRWELAGVVD